MAWGEVVLDLRVGGSDRLTCFMIDVDGRKDDCDDLR